MPAPIFEQFQRVLGRDPRADELEYFGRFLENSDLQPNEIGQILEASPEFQQVNLRKQGQQYNDYLSASDKYNLGRAQEDIAGNFRAMGRPESSGMAGAFASVAKDLAARKQDALASFYGGGLQNIMASQVDTGSAVANRGYGLRDKRTDRAWALEDYYRQKNDYQDMMNQQGKMNLKNQLIGGGIGLASSLAGGFATNYGMKAGLGLLGGGGKTNFQGYMPERGF